MQHETQDAADAAARCVDALLHEIRSGQPWQLGVLCPEAHDLEVIRTRASDRKDSSHRHPSP